MDAIEIPYTKLKPETLNRIIEEFICREGTDYGHQEYDLETKVQQVQQQLRSKRAKLWFDPQSETCTIKAED